MTARTLSPHEALVLQGLADQWAGLFEVDYADGTFTAKYRSDGDGVPPLTSGTLEGLASAMRTDFYRRITR